MIFVDTCILIDYSKGKILITEEDKKKLCINSIVQLEFLVGAFNKDELREFNKVLKNWNLAHIDQDIMNLSVQLMNRYGLSHGMSVYDSIIASTCMIYDLSLWTHNKKDFKFLDINLI
jgi:predicted nucleic acid-binding protein